MTCCLQYSSANHHSESPRKVKRCLSRCPSTRASRRLLIQAIASMVARSSAAASRYASRWTSRRAASRSMAKTASIMRRRTGRAGGQEVEHAARRVEDRVRRDAGEAVRGVPDAARWRMRLHGLGKVDANDANQAPWRVAPGPRPEDSDNRSRNGRRGASGCVTGNQDVESARSAADEQSICRRGVDEARRESGSDRHERPIARGSVIRRTPRDVSQLRGHLGESFGRPLLNRPAAADVHANEVSDSGSRIASRGDRDPQARAGPGRLLGRSPKTLSIVARWRSYATADRSKPPDRALGPPPSPPAVTAFRRPDEIAAHVGLEVDREIQRSRSPHAAQRLILTLSPRAPASAMSVATVDARRRLQRARHSSCPRPDRFAPPSQ